MVKFSSEPFLFSEYEKSAFQRSVEELLACGVINLNKPSGPSSHQVTAWVKEILNVKKAGHGGTLDPNVSGVLPIGLNSAVRALDALLLGKKEYVGIMRLHDRVDVEKLTAVFEEFKGEIYQLPPVRAAVKRVLRKRKIYRLEILEIEDKDILFRVECEAGTYIRTLCVDLGDALSVGGNLRELRRTRSANFGEENSISLQELKDAYVEWQELKNEKNLKNIILPLESLLAHLPKIIVKDTAVAALCHGANLATPGVVETNGNIKAHDTVALYTLNGEAIGIGKALLDEKFIQSQKKGICVKIKKIFMSPKKYPSYWKKNP